MKHIVHREIIDLSVGTLGQAAKWEARFSDLLQTTFTPRINAAFDAYSSPDKEDIIHQIVLDMGVINSAMSEGELADRISSQLSAQLKSSDGIRLKQNDIAEKVQQHLSRHRSASREDMILYFLEHGILPWWASSNSVDEIVLNPDAFDISFSERLKLLLKRSAGTLARFAGIVSLKGCADWISIWDEQAALKMRSLMHWLEINVVYPSSHRKFVEMHFVLLWLQKTLQHTTGEVSHHLIIQLIKMAPHIKEKLLAILVPGVVTSSDQVIINAFEFIAPGISQDIRFQPQLFELTATAPDNSPLNDFAELTDDTMGEIADQPVATTAHDEVQLPDVTRIFPEDAAIGSSHEKGKDNDIGVSVSNACLVLLHPFLSELFATCGFRRNNKWVNKQAQHMAVATLVYCGHGYIHLPEYEILIEKLLCGMPWSEAYFPPEHFSEEIMKNCEGLLHAVIAHWKAPGDISSDGLREGFLQRAAMVYRGDQDWTVIVEKKAQDILLARLPWGISRIKLSWMPTQLNVNWT